MKKFAIVKMNGIPIDLDVLDPSDSCNAYDSARCGGCDECLLMQAEHNGFEIDWVEAETVLEAAMATLAEWKRRRNERRAARINPWPPKKA